MSSGLETTSREADQTIIANLVSELSEQYDKLVVDFETDQKSRRRETRHAYETMIEIVVNHEAGTIPRESDFQQAKCRELNSGGLSFLLDDRPKTGTCVIKLNAGSEKLQVEAKVRHVTPVDDDSPNSGFVVGCSFSNRLDR